MGFDDKTALRICRITVSPTSMSFGADGGSKSFTVSSYKRKVLDGVEQSGDTSVSLKSTEELYMLVILQTYMYVQVTDIHQ